MKQPSPIRRLVGSEDLLRPTARRLVLLGIGLVLAGLAGFAIALALPDDLGLFAEGDDA